MTRCGDDINSERRKKSGGTSRVPVMSTQRSEVPGKKSLELATWVQKAQADALQCCHAIGGFGTTLILARDCSWSWFIVAPPFPMMLPAPLLEMRNFSAHVSLSGSPSARPPMSGIPPTSASPGACIA
jgi:hypothetical protein